MHSVCPDVPMIPVIEMKKGLQSSVDSSVVVTYLRDKDTDSLGVSRVSGLFQESSTQCRPATVLRFPVSTPGDASVMNEAKWLEKATKNDGAHVYPRLLAICASEKAVYLVLAGELKRDLSLESAPSELASNGSIKSLVHDLLAAVAVVRYLGGFVLSLSPEHIHISFDGKGELHATLTRLPFATLVEKDGPTAVDGSAGFGSVTSMSKEVFTAIGASTTGAIAIAEPEKNDVWAVAAVITAKLIELLYGHQKPLHQFTSSVIRQCLDAAGVSNEGAGLLMRMLSQSPADRPTLDEALGHKWFLSCD